VQVGKEIIISYLPNQGYFKKFRSNLIILLNIISRVLYGFIELKIPSHTI
jgi:hypothetical protein